MDALEFLKQKSSLQHAFSKMKSHINNEHTKMGVFLTNKNFTVADANDIYRNCAKQTFHSLVGVMEKCKGLGLSSLDAPLKTVKQTNQTNIANISSSIASFKNKQIEKPELRTVYLDSLTFLNNTIATVEKNILTELTDNQQLSSGKKA